MTFSLIIFSTLLSLIFGILRYAYSYWEQRGVKQLRTHFLFGNFFKLKSVHYTDLIHEVYQEFKGKEKIAGTYVFLKPHAIVLDLDLAKNILIKDFNKFINRNDRSDEDSDPVSAHLFNLGDSKWRNMRTKLTPTFTSGKMKYMFPTVLSVAKEFAAALEKEMQTNNGIVEIYDINGRFTTDVIGTCAFGIDCNSLKDPNVEFRKVGRQIFKNTPVNIRWVLFRNTYTSLARKLHLTRFRGKVQDFIMRVVRETISLREEKNIKRNDFIDLLIEMKNSKDVNGVPGLTVEQLAAQVFVFFAAGFETSSSNMTYGLYELAKNPDVQEKLRAEILDVLEKYDNELTYEAMMEMTYLDQVVTETLRKYPALSTLTRIAKEDYQIPDTDIIIEKDVTVIIPARDIHYDPDIYDNPEEFRPERFSSEEEKLRHPQSFLGFGDGPRNCIGLRFGRMQVRIGFVTLLRSFRFSLCEQSQKNIEHSKYAMVLIPGSGVYLKVEKL